MCIHHIAHHVPCGHTTQPLNHSIPSHCLPVTQALDFYHDQPNRALYNREGRCYTLEPMRIPRVCGADSLHSLRTIHDISALSNNSSRSCAPRQPKSWHPAMTLFLLDLFRNSEPLPSVHILLETEYPQLSGQVSLDFLNYIQSAFHGHGELFFDPSKDLQNEGLAGDIITFNVNMGCGRTKSGDERCLQGWDNMFGGKTVCPHLQAVETGRYARGSTDPFTTGALLTFWSAKGLSSQSHGIQAHLLNPKNRQGKMTGW